MDDLGLLNRSGSIWQRSLSIFQDYYAFGELKWTHSLYCGIFYKIFADNPNGFHIFKWSQVIAMFLVYGALAYQITRRSIAFLLIPAISLSFHYLYDQFFFLTTQENTGLLFLGLSFLTITSLQNDRLSSSQKIIWSIIAFLEIILALGAKETFFVGILALGSSCIWWGLNRKTSKRVSLISGLLLILLGVCYGLFLKLIVSKGYTSTYSLNNFPAIISNLSTWFKKDFLNHLPWIIAAIWLLLKNPTNKKHCSFTSLERYGLLLGALSYIFFLGILLPWNVTSYYAGPLGIFFALILTIILSSRIEQLKLPPTILLVSFVCLLNIAVCFYALHREATYHQNTQGLWTWIKNNPDFQDLDRQENVCCNANEASYAIPQHANRWWNLNLKPFKYVLSLQLPLRTDCKMFVSSSRFEKINASDMRTWTEEFHSKFWSVYQRH
ncbi:MAG: hypothetical protein HQL15_00810 [Candidatus Omnitrophica bacterium]|nr:hypothetical protein [Candidatus Omnitrophota bacterium]